MKIADGIEMIELPVKAIGNESIIYPTLIWDEGTVILVDAGMSGSLPEIKNAMENAGVPFERLNKIIVTHQDIDHIGGIKNILNELSEVNVLAHKEDKPYIQGEKKLVRLNSNFMERINDLPEEEQKKVLDMLENISVPVDMTLEDGEELTDCGGIVVIHTPGHTPGHICLYHKASKTIIMGDAMNIMDKQLTGPNTLLLTEEDAKKAVNSLKKFEKYDVENVITYHGGLFNNKPNQRIKEFNDNEA
ncbi:MBL fold metallo-hydrolase [Methanobacterium sp.]|uniref:MBL fold metallo-hydrolase n=1 Tax=Methanobacterium sp. TaxID=2164 RepID=UPI003C70C013